MSFAQEQAAMPPPTSGPVPDRGPNLIALLWVTTSLAFCTVIMRFAYRFTHQGMGWDDIFMVLAMMCFFGWSITLTLLCLKGGERHIQDVGALGIDVVAEVQLLNWTSQVFGILGVCFGKISVSALLLNILKRTQRPWQKYYIWTFCIIIAALASVACAILTFSQCRPAAALWDPRVVGTCIDPHVMSGYGTFMGSYNTFVDASLALLPSTIFWSLKISTEDKIKLSIVFALNILTSISSGIKTSYLSQLANREDLTWATYDIFVWVTVEFFLVVVCGTVPTLRSLFDIVAVCFSRQISSLRSKGNYEHYGHGSDPNHSSNTELAAVNKSGAKAKVAAARDPHPLDDSDDDSSKHNASLPPHADGAIRVKTTMDVDYDAHEPVAAAR